MVLDISKELARVAISIRDLQRSSRITRLLDDPEFHKKAPADVIAKMQAEEIEFERRTLRCPWENLAIRNGKIRVDYVLADKCMADELTSAVFDTIEDALDMIYRLDRKYNPLMFSDPMRAEANS
jgi:hypothetical protein